MDYPDLATTVSDLIHRVVSTSTEDTLTAAVVGLDRVAGLDPPPAIADVVVELRKVLSDRLHMLSDQREAARDNWVEELKALNIKAEIRKPKKRKMLTK